MCAVISACATGDQRITATVLCAARLPNPLLCQRWRAPGPHTESARHPTDRAPGPRYRERRRAPGAGPDTQIAGRDEQARDALRLTSACHPSAHPHPRTLSSDLPSASRSHPDPHANHLCTRRRDPASNPSSVPPIQPVPPALIRMPHIQSAASSDPHATYPARRVPFFQERTPNITVWGKTVTAVT